ncbi:GntR family transcriptional regulator [Motilibacter rhizosphaerae]|uniref:GntR family transcriptional regulator n=1 Tax=Motilibacter rhizosphaerae TaxID=598652 RepID=A0A4Q7NSD7_9ACTN|nr:GntR family transcriptional regulator [Motilibacter rhizosphaerae]RZS90043.1 GntR family transcriptional regulator [Motilibacter rhizosphaerae]
MTDVPRPRLGATAEDVRRHLLALAAGPQGGPGARLGGERELAVRLACSRSTLRDALAALEDEGVVRRVPGRRGGTFVAAPRVQRDLARLRGVPAMLAEQGFAATTTVLGVRLVPGPLRTCEELGLPPGSLVTEVLRLRAADGVPLSVERAELPAARFPGLAERRLDGSVYALLAEAYGLRLGAATERITAVAASPHDAAALQVEVGSPLLAVTRTTVDADGVPFEHAHDLFRGDRVELLVATPAERATLTAV